MKFLTQSSAWVVACLALSLTSVAYAGRLPQRGAAPFELPPPVSWKASSAPVVNWKALRAIGLTGAGIRIGLYSGGMEDFKQAVAAGLLPANTLLTEGGNGGSDPLHGLATAVAIHAIAPGATLVVCAGGGCYSTLTNSTYHVQVVVDNLDIGVWAPFSYNNSNSSGTQWHVTSINAHPKVLYFEGGTDNWGPDFFEGSWVPVSATVGGQTQTVEDFGAALGAPSEAYETIGDAYTGKASYPIMLETVDPVASDTAGMGLQVYDANGHPVDGSFTYPGECAGANGCVVVPEGTPVPLKIYAVAYTAAGAPNGQLSPQTRIKLYIGLGNDGVIGGVKFTTPGGIGPFIPGAGTNALMVGGATTPSRIFLGSGVGPLLAYNTDTQTFNTFQYPTVIGDWCSPLPPLAGVPGWPAQFCGTSNAAPELAAVAALLLQAGLSSSDVSSAMKQTAINPNMGTGTWGAHWGYGYVDPLAALAQQVTLPLPGIAGATGVSLTPNQAHTFSGSCTVNNGGTLTGYAWNFGDGTSATGTSATHAWAQSGTYTVSLNCSESTASGLRLSSATPGMVTVNVSGGSSGGGGGNGGGGGGGNGGSGSGSSSGGGALGLLTLALLALLALRPWRRGDSIV